MIAQSFDATQYVMNAETGAVGLVHAVVTSPYYREEMQGIKRVQVWTEVPGAGNKKHYNWDFWLVEECVLLPDAPVATGATVHMTNRQGQSAFGIVMAASYEEVCVMFADGSTGWARLPRINYVYTPRLLTNSVLQIA